MSSINNDPKSPSSSSGSPFSPYSMHAEPYATPGIPPGPETPKKSGWGCVGCLLGCLGITLVLGAVAGFSAWYFVTKMLPDVIRDGVAKGIEESELTPDDKRVVLQQVDRVVDGYKKGKVDFQKLGRIGEEFARSPLMDLLVAFGAKKKYIESSGLSDEEKAEAERTLQRVARGVIEEKIADSKLDTAMNHISDEMSNGSRQLKEQVSDAELREFLAECKKLADDAGVPDEQVEVDIGAEFKKIVDKALGESPPEEAASSIAPPPAPEKPEPKIEPDPAQP